MKTKAKRKMGIKMMSRKELETKGLPWFKSKAWQARKQAIRDRVNKKNK